MAVVGDERQVNWQEKYVDQVAARLDNLERGQQELRADLRTEAAALRTELRTETTALRTELRTLEDRLGTEIREGDDGLRSEIRELRSEIRRLFLALLGLLGTAVIGIAGILVRLAGWR